MLTLQELKDWLESSYDVYDLIDLLELTGQDIVNAFSDHIEENFDRLENEMELFTLKEFDED